MTHNAKKDDNFVSSVTIVSNTDGKTIILGGANPTTHKIKFRIVTSGVDYGPKNALKDENAVSTLLAVSENDGKSIVSIYGDVNGNIFIQN